MKKAYIEWIERADDDIRAAGILLANDDFPPNVVCFLCQQSAEKYIKAYLTFRGKEFIYTHNLLLLLDNYLVKDETDFSGLRNSIALLNEYSVKPRYPDFLEQYSADDAIEAYDTAMGIITFIKGKMP